MGEVSEISWCYGTFNIVWGCQKVSAGCENCYAMAWAKRMGYNVWGPAKTTPRRLMSDAYWRQPLKWNADAQKLGERRRVFCSSMADVFEDHPTVESQRPRLWGLISATPALDWLLLTKRPENINDMVPGEWRIVGRWPANVWVGTTVENQEMADKRIPELVKVPARVRFLSCEPLLEPVDLGQWLDVWEETGIEWAGMSESYRVDPPFHWVIAGGESGPKARPMHPDWVRSLRDQCVAARVAFHFKQRGEWTWDHPQGLSPTQRQRTFLGNVQLYRVGKHEAGRELDGRTWDEYPAVAA